MLENWFLQQIPREGSEQLRYADRTSKADGFAKTVIQSTQKRVEKYMQEICDPQKARRVLEQPIYVAGVLRCLWYHWEEAIAKAPQDELVDGCNVAEAIADGRSHADDSELGGDVLRDTVLAAAIVLRNTAAIELFEREFKPKCTKWAQIRLEDSLDAHPDWWGDFLHSLAGYAKHPEAPPKAKSSRAQDESDSYWSDDDEDEGTDMVEARALDYLLTLAWRLAPEEEKASPKTGRIRRTRRLDDPSRQAAIDIAVKLENEFQESFPEKTPLDDSLCQKAMTYRKPSRRLDSYRGIGSLGKWLSFALRSFLYDLLEPKQKQFAFLDGDGDDGDGDGNLLCGKDGPAQLAQNHERHRLFVRVASAAMERLQGESFDQYRAFVFRIVEGMSLAETSDLLLPHPETDDQLRKNLACVATWTKRGQEKFKKFFSASAKEVCPGRTADELWEIFEDAGLAGALQETCHEMDQSELANADDCSERNDT